MTLAQGVKGKKYTVRSLHAEPRVLRRLEALGMIEGTSVLVLNKKEKGAFIIKLRGTRWAVGRKIAEGIEIEEREE